MPFYEFICRSCGHQFEEILSIKEFEERERTGFVCVKCGDRGVEQQVSVSVHTSKKS